MLSHHQDPGPEFVGNFMRRALEDPDPVMAESAVIQLLAHPAVAESTLDHVEERLPASWKTARQHLRERRVRLPIERGDLCQSRLLAAVAVDSGRVQLWMLDEVDLPASVLRVLASEGVTRAIRNRARQRLAGD